MNNEIQNEMKNLESKFGAALNGRSDKEKSAENSSDN